jgi:hypothetical protein
MKFGVRSHTLREKGIDHKHPRTIGLCCPDSPGEPALAAPAQAAPTLRCQIRRRSLSLLILAVDDEADVAVLFRQQFRRDLRAGRAQSAPMALQRIAERQGYRSS